MPRKRLPIFQKVSNLLKISLFVARMRKPVIPKLIFLKKSRKLKSFKLLKHYNYGFMEEYEFSPSGTPLVSHQAKQLKTRRCRDTMLFYCRCLGGLKGGGGGGGENMEYRLSMETLPTTIGAGECSQPFDLGVEDDDEEDSVDQRAERFIERFYQEMRMQRQESI